MQRVTPSELRSLLWQPEPAADAGLAFDGDGTLWRGDVADDLFFDAIGRRLLRPAAHGALRALAERVGVEAAEDESNALASALFRAHREQRLDEEQTYGMMAWCWAGWGQEELRNHARAVLTERGLVRRSIAATQEALREATQRGRLTALISASPYPILEAALDVLGLRPTILVATRPKTVLGLIEATLEGDVPYGEAKAVYAQGLLPPDRWAAAFGDSHFDLELLRLARLAVVVGENPSLLRALAAASSRVVCVAPGD